jgi:poly(hydroxyalkanoate) depolymerase family esterase
MRALGETTALLARLRRQREAFPATQQAETRFTPTARFGANPGALRMLSYVPDGLAEGSPLVVVLHGCTQKAEAHAVAAGWLELADRYGFAVLAPEQTPANNSNRCFNWFEPADAARGQGEAASIRAMVAHAVRTHGLDASRVFVTGLSAGGAMTSVMLAAYPEVFAAGAIVAGLPYGVAENLSQALGAMFGRGARSSADLGRLVRSAAPAGGRIPRVSIWHGDADHTVQPYNAVEIAKQWAAVHGLPAEPSESKALKGRTRAVWRSADGEVLIESNLVHGFGHGTPLSTGGEEGVGSVAPYMLEAGVSSSLEIARFWGLAKGPAAARKARPAAPARPANAQAKPTRPRAAAAKARGPVLVPPPAPATDLGLAAAGSSIQHVIEKALRTAGLMK